MRLKKGLINRNEVILNDISRLSILSFLVFWAILKTCPEYFVRQLGEGDSLNKRGKTIYHDYQVIRVHKIFVSFIIWPIVTSIVFILLL